MMKPISMMRPGERIWRVVYPVLIYLASAMAVEFVWMLVIELGMILRDGTMDLVQAEEIFYENVLGITCVTNLITALAAGYCYKRDLKRFKPVKKEVAKNWYILVAVMGVTLSLALNGLMNLLGVFEAFADDYDQMANALYGGPILLEIITVVILAPLAEELIFRGLVFKRMRTYMTFLPAAITSSLMFAFFHGNILQGAYSFFLALMMAYLYEHFRNLWSVFLFHGAANAFSVLITESQFVNQWFSNDWIYYAVLSVSIVTSLAGLYYMMEYFRKKEEVN